MSGGSAEEVPVVASVPPPIAEAISESGERAELTAVEPLVESAEDRASLKLVGVEPVVARVAASVAPADATPDVVWEPAAPAGSENCCRIARIWPMRLSTASILILHRDRRRRRQLEAVTAESAASVASDPMCAT